MSRLFVVFLKLCGIRGILALVLAGLSSQIRAEVWTYRDELGVVHFATEKKDERYQLFFKGGSSLDAPAPDPALLARDQSTEAFRATPLFQRIGNNANARRFDTLIEASAKKQKLDPALVKAVIAAESAFQADAVSPKGALGLMQIIPETGARYGVVGDRKQSAAQKLFDPATNIQVGTRYLRDLLNLFPDDLKLVLAAYNAGEQTVLRYNHTVPPFPETRDYVKLVEQFYSAFRPQPVKPPPGRSLRPMMRGVPQPRAGIAEAEACLRGEKSAPGEAVC